MMAKQTPVKQQPTNEVVPHPSTEVAPQTLDTVQRNAAAKVFTDNVKGPREAPVRIPIIKLDHRAPGFILPTGEVVPLVAGYPVYYFKTRSYYRESYRSDAPGTPPNCWSADDIVPHPSAMDPQSETCAKCPMNLFKSGRDGRSKACGTKLWIFLVNPKFGKPPVGVIVAPTSSIKAMLGTKFEMGYFGKAESKHEAFEIVWTRFRLRQEGDPRAVQYAVLEPEMGEPASEKLALNLVQIRNHFLNFMEGMRETTPDVAEPEDQEASGDVVDGTTTE
jgi:hypothetical protein